MSSGSLFLCDLLSMGTIMIVVDDLQAAFNISCSPQGQVGKFCKFSYVDLGPRSPHHHVCTTEEVSPPPPFLSK
jgi:hypothetical protein